MNTDGLRKTYNRIAQDFTDEHYSNTWDDDYLRLFANSLLKGAKVLDLGCGAGNDTAKLDKMGFATEGIDLSDKLIEIVKQKTPNLKFVQGDMLKLPYKDASFDGVFAKASILHIAKEDVPKVLAEIKRVLKPKGIVHIAIKGGEGEGLINEDDYGYKYQRFFSYWKMEPFVELLKKQSYKIVRKEVWRRTPESYTIWLKILAQKSE